MADAPTGVTPARGRGRRGQRGGGSFLKRNRAVVLGAGGIGAILLMSHKGGSGTSTSGSGTSPQDQLGAYQQGVQDAGGLIGQTTGSGGGGSIGGGTAGDTTGSAGSGGGSGGDSPTPSDTSGDVTAAGDGGPLATGSAPVGPINVTVNAAQAKKTPAKKKTGAAQSKAAAKAKTRGQTKATGSKSGQARKTPGAPHSTPRPAPKQPAHGKPAPAAKSGTHPATPKKTPKGRKKNSPALVESMFGLGAGIVIMGRQFPGAQSYRMGPPFTDSAGRVSRRCVIDYGGRSEQHVCHGDGTEWTDNLPGVNPPSRGVPMTMGRAAA